MAVHSKEDMEYAAAFRADVHKEALAKARRLRPSLTSVADPNPVETYFQKNWEYPGRWYTVVAIPGKYHSREALVDDIVRHTLAQYRETAAAEEPSGDSPKPAPPEETRQTEPGGCLADDPFYKLIAQYPDLAVEYCIVPGEPAAGGGYAAHRRALASTCRALFAKGGWHGDAEKAKGRQIDSEALFSSVCRNDELNYRKAFLHPPHGNGCTGADFVKVNEALFPQGTEALEVWAWTTDWSDYFNEGHEWWGALCLTVYDRRMDRFAVILAAATD